MPKGVGPAAGILQNAARELFSNDISLNITSTGPRSIVFAYCTNLG